MRIIIVQAEIEAAIEQYVRNQVDIKEGQEISIDFKATRGEDGATADINIGPAKVEAIKPTPVKRTGTRVQSNDPVTEQVQETPQTAQESEKEAETVEDTTATETPAETSSEAVETTVETPEAEAKPSTSLFAGMRRPNNG